MRFSFAALIDHWRTRLTRIENMLSAQPYDSWRLRLERRVLVFCLRRHVSGPVARPPSQAAMLDPESAERSRRLWLRPDPPPRPMRFKVLSSMYGAVRDAGRRD